MKAEEVKLLYGKPKVVLEYRNGGDVQTIPYRDKATGQMTTFEIRKYHCENAETQVALSLPRDVPKDYKFTDPKNLQKGSRYLIEVHEWQTVKGATSCTGLILELVA